MINSRSFTDKITGSIQDDCWLQVAQDLLARILFSTGVGSTQTIMLWRWICLRMQEFGLQRNHMSIEQIETEPRKTVLWYLKHQDWWRSLPCD